MQLDLNTIWFILVGVLLTGYAVLDGFEDKPDGIEIKVHGVFNFWWAARVCRTESNPRHPGRAGFCR
jgi:hypothetical protein